nr:uncharacterized protein LOC105885499 isoform X8 [Microcebus murinus]
MQINPVSAPRPRALQQRLPRTPRAVLGPGHAPRPQTGHFRIPPRPSAPGPPPPSQGHGGGAYGQRAKAEAEAAPRPGARGAGVSRLLYRPQGFGSKSGTPPESANRKKLTVPGAEMRNQLEEGLPQDLWEAGLRWSGDGPDRLRIALRRFPEPGRAPRDSASAPGASGRFQAGQKRHAAPSRSHLVPTASPGQDKTGHFQLALFYRWGNRGTGIKRHVLGH